MIGQAADSWDSISAASPGVLLTLPALPVWTARQRAPGYLRITPGTDFPAFRDTFPAGSAEQRDVVLTAQRVAVLEARPHALTATLPYPPPYIVFFRARIFLAAADDWSRHGDLPEAELALDSTLALARMSLHATDLERIATGARIERDALDLLSRDTLLAGGPAVAGRAAAAIASWGRFEGRLEAADHWMMAAGSSNVYDDSLAALAEDSALPIAWRAAAATALGVGWVFNSDEQGKGMAPARVEALRVLQASPVPDSVAAAIERARALSTGGFMDRVRAMAAFRVQRRMLHQP